MKTFLHLGCGFRSQQQTTTFFATEEWKELRVDINPGAQPHILASVTDLSPVATESADAAYLSHIIEHIYAYEVPGALREIHRTLKPDGFAIFRCPDMQGIAALVAEGRLNDALYETPAEGPISAHDMIYGHTRSLARGEKGMAHRCGFTAQTLLDALNAAKFNTVVVGRRGSNGMYLELWALATKEFLPQQEMAERLSWHSTPPKVA